MADPVGFALNIAIQAAISLIIAALRPKQEIEGPRLDDTSISSAAYGKTIPIGYGSDVVGGNIIWGKDIEEVKKKYNIGKGNPFSLGTRTEYKYYLTCAVGISQREVENLIGIYADGKLIYDAEAIDGRPSGNLHPFLDSVPESERVNDKGKEKAPPIIKNLEFNFYRGTATQEQDPIMAADVGEDVCPAYRGLAYIVFNRMPLKDLGNRVPQFRFIVSWGATDSEALKFRSIGYDEPVNTVSSTHPWVYDRDRQVVYSIKEGRSGWTAPDDLQPGFGGPLIDDHYLEAADAVTGEQLSVNQNIYLRTEYVDGSTIVQDEARPIRALIGAAGDYLVARANDSFGSGAYTALAAYDKDDMTITGSTGDNRRAVALMQAAGSSDTAALTGWTYRTANAVNFSGGMAGVYLPTLSGIVSFIVGGPSLNAYGAGGSHQHSFTILSPPSLSIFYYENSIEPQANNINGHELWKIGEEEPTDGKVFGYGFIAAIQGALVNPGEIGVSTTTYLYVFMGTDPNPPVGQPVEEGYRVYTCLLNSGGNFTTQGDYWLTPVEFGDSNTGAAGELTMSFDPEENALILMKSGLWIAYDMDPTLDRVDGRPPEKWRRTDLQRVSRSYESFHRRPENSRLVSRRTGVNSAEGIFDVIDTSTGLTVKSYTAPSFTEGDTLATNYIPCVYEPGYDRGLVFQEITSESTVFGFQYFRPELVRGTETLATVVSDIVTRGKLNASDIDVTNLAGTNVKGYVIGRNTTYRKALEPLQTAYNFLGVERDGKVVFEIKDGVTDIVVPEDDFVRSSRKNIFEEERKDEVTVPRMVFLNYRSDELKDETATQHARQITDTYLTVGSEGDVNTEVPLVLSGQEAADIAARILYESRLSLENFKFTLPPQYLRATPGDVIQVTAAGRVETIRATQVSVGFDLEVEIEGSLVDGDVYSPNTRAATAYGSPNFTAGSIAPILAPAVEGQLIDVPPLRYDMLSSLSRTQGAYYGFLAGLPRVYQRYLFTGGALQVSYNEGSSYDFRASSDTPVAYGILSGGVPNIPSANFNGVQDTSIVVQVVDGYEDFVSVTQAEMIGEQENTALLYSPTSGVLEVIRFQTVTEIPTAAGLAQLELSGLMRGQRGTNIDALRWQEDLLDHGTIYLYVLSDETFTVFPEPLSKFGDTVLYRTVPTGGEDLSTLRTKEITYTHRGLKPFSPANVKLFYDDPSGGEYEIRWNRRTRAEGAWRNYTGYVELEENSEAYEIDILDGSGGTVLRTLESTTESVLYGVDEIDADFGSSGLPSPLYVRVYQISAQVGRGYSYEAALTVEE